MAGKKQHFIPRHFLKPFTIPGRRDHLWMYRKDQPSAIRVSRNDAAAQKYFYSRPSGEGLPTLDDLMTEYEVQLHRTVDEIRSLQIGEVIDGAKIAQIVAHLMVRSSHMRGTMREAIVSISNSLQNLTGGGSETFLFELPRHGPPKPVYRMISEELTNLGLTEITPITERTIIDLLYLAMRERGSDALDEVLPLLTRTLEELRTEASEMSRRAQVTALGKTMIPEERVVELSKLMWQVLPAHGHGAILPDCTSIAFNGREWQPLLLTSSDELAVVVLALAPNRLAVGKVETDWDLDLSQYNRHAAEASYSFFLANCNSKSFSELIGQLGGKIRTSLENLVKNSVVEAIGDLLRDTDDENQLRMKAYAGNKSWKTTVEEERQQYFVSFEDFGDEEFAKSVAKEINSVVIAFAKHLPISSIEGFVFANDYKTALNRTDRGIEPIEEIVPVETEEFIGIGMPLAVVSNGRLKTRVVLRAMVAVDLISEDSVSAEDARSVIVHMLASSALRGLIATKFPYLISRPVCDQFDAFLHDYASGVFEAYFCASLSTRSEKQLERRESLALAALREALNEIPVKRKAYIHGGDLESFFAISANLSVNALSFLAALFGAYKGLGQTIPHSNAVLAILAEYGLDQWADLFNADLAAFDAGLEEWAEFEEMFFVHRHFQRFLAHFAIVPDRHDVPGAYVHVPWIPSDGSSLR